MLYSIFYALKKIEVVILVVYDRNSCGGSCGRKIAAKFPPCGHAAARMPCGRKKQFRPQYFM